MANYTDSVVGFLKGARALTANSTFQSQCIDRLLSSNRLANLGFVNSHGQLINDAISSTASQGDIWGIDYTTCSASCFYSDLPFPFSYSTFSSAMTNYLLPWLALTAQLPYETKTHPSNIMVLFLALGSPVLITYSLSLTVIHSYKLKKIFEKLKGLRKINYTYKEHLDTIQEVLQASQHAPLRASQYNGWLSSLLVLKDNDKWWSNVKDFLMGRVRDFSPSALAQIGVAVVAWLLTIVAALSEKLGDPDTGLQIASGSLWIWLVPVVVGYIKVGVPNSAKATPEAFAQSGASNAQHAAADHRNPADTDYSDDQGSVQAAAAAAVVPADANNEDANAADGIEMAAIARTSSTNTRTSNHLNPPVTPVNGPSHQRSSSHSSSAVSPGRTAPPVDVLPPLPNNVTSHDSSERPWDSAVHLPPRRCNTLLDDDNMRGIRTSGDVFQADGEPVDIDQMPTALGLPVLGDANIPGAAYTYARSLEFPFFVELISNALAHSIRGGPGRESAGSDQTPEAIARQCGEDWEVDMRLNPFPRWSQVPAEWWHRLVVAALVALFVQWGTTMSSFMLALLTPVQGLGCRSGSYIIYGLASTIAWLLLVAAQLFANEAMRIYQEKKWRSAGGSQRPQVISNDREDDAQAEPTPRARRQSTVQVEDNTVGQDSEVKFRFCKVAAVLCRISGKGLCVLNTVWLLLTSLAEIIGGFENCWCLANRPSTSEGRGWIVLFKTSEDLADQARSSWAGGFAITIAVSVVAILFFTIGSPRHKSL